MYGILTVVFIGLLSYFLYTDIKDHRENEEMLYRFELRCDSLQGIVLEGRKNGKGWIGCYKGLTEIENEEK